VRALEVGRRRNPRARINLGVSTFVPKPLTPFQWAEQIGIEETRRRQRILADALRRHKAIKFGRHDPEDSFIEGMLSRADRRAADLIERAYRLGCRFDGWSEHRRFDLWQRAAEEVGFDAQAHLAAREVSDRLPWDHVDILVDPQWLVDDWERALVLEHAEDCRHSKCHKCGVIDKKRPLCAHMLRRSIKGRKEEQDFTTPPLPKVEEPPTVQRLVLRVGRSGTGRFLTHHETMNAWLRALRRAEMPLSYSEGFHAHPKVAFSTAFPVGEETRADFLDARLFRRVRPEEAAESIASTLPSGLDLLGAGELPLGAKALMDQVRGAGYRIFLPADPEEVIRRIEDLRRRDEIVIERRQRKKGRERVRRVDIKPRIDRLAVEVASPSTAIDSQRPTTVAFDTSDPDGRLVRPRDILPLIAPCAVEDCLVRKVEAYAFSGERLVPVSELWSVGSVSVAARSA
jgi:radical SAM-linked protein